MQHVDSLSIYGIDVGSVLYKKMDQTHIAMEASKVKSCEAIVTPTRSVQPRLQLTLPLALLFLPIYAAVCRFSASSIQVSISLLRSVRQNELNENFTGFLDIFVGGVVDWRVSALVIDIEDIEFVFCRVQVIFELVEVHTLNELEDELLLPALLQ